jgi:hypothetical protein
MATIEERLAALERDNIETKRKLGELEGSFQFISSQLSGIQTYMPGRFDQIDAPSTRWMPGSIPSTAGFIR